VRFAGNEVVLLYSSEKSRYADEITPDNWYDILRRPDVTLGFSDPNGDPGGYRALMVCQLAELYYKDQGIFEDIVGDNTGISVKESNGNYEIIVPKGVKGNDKVHIGGDLLSGIRSGSLDYCFIYRSSAVQNSLPL